jgi:phenylacetate-CoA ligase
MHAVPHSIFSGALWPAVPQTKAASLLAMQQQLQESQFLPLDELGALQFRQIGAIVAHIDRAVPHYGASLRKVGIKPGRDITEEAWARVPILTRRAVQDAGAALHAKELPQGHGRTGLHPSSGTTGMPVKVVKTELFQFYLQAMALREEMWRRRDLGAKILGVRRDNERKTFEKGPHLRRMPDWGPPVATVYPSGPSVMLDYRCTAAEQAEVLESERPGYLVIYPSLLLELLRHYRAQGSAAPLLKGVTTLREPLAPETSHLCREIFGVAPIDIYSAGETGTLAFPCPEQGSLHVQAETTLVEIVDDAGRPCGPGEVGRVLVTPLHNFAMPLLRYEIGDLAEVGAPCACGRTLPVIARIVGRARDMLVLPSGEKRYPYYGHDAMVRVDAIRQHQLVQTSPEAIEIRLVVRRPLTPAEEAHILATAADGLGYPFHLKLAYCDEIKRDPSGKYAEFRSNVVA